LIINYNNIFLISKGSAFVLASNDDDNVVQLISAAVKRKKASLGGHSSSVEDIAKSKNRPMILIGG
jgi:hypothetical protein